MDLPIEIVDLPMEIVDLPSYTMVILPLNMLFSKGFPFYMVDFPVDTNQLVIQPAGQSMSKLLIPMYPW